MSITFIVTLGRERFDEVTGTGRFNALLVIVIDLQAKVVFGYIIFDLNPEYGVSGGHPRNVR